MVRRAGRAAAICCLAACAGFLACGDALTDGRYQGEPRLTVRGRVDSLAAAPPNAPVRAGLYWGRNDADGGVATTFQTADIQGQAFPFTFEMRFFDRPDPAYFQSLNAYAQLGAGYFLVFADGNGNQTFDVELMAEGSSEALLGLSLGHMLLYVPEESPELTVAIRAWGAIVNPERLEAGFNLARGVCGPRSDAGELLQPNRLEIVSAEDEEITVTSFGSDATRAGSQGYCVVELP